MNYLNKKISIIGSQKSGIAAARLIKNAGGIPFVSDNSIKEKLKNFISILKNENIPFEVEQHSEKVFDCELMILSPGVPSDAAVLKTAKEKNIKIISEIELAASYCKGKIIAITGSNGKTTTTSLFEHILNSSGFTAYAAGNIGKAFSEIVLDIKENEFVSLEVSSFQLDFIEKFKPFISMILNITPDHLNRYEYKFENYLRSKYRIFENQDQNDNLILNDDDEMIKNFAINSSAKKKYFSLFNNQSDGCFYLNNEMKYVENNSEKFNCSVKDFSLQGEHNIANAMAAIIAAKIVGVENENLRNALKSFKGVEHRLEFVKKIDGIKYINDSKATNVDSVWYALRSFENPIFLILGGQDKGNDYSKIKDLVINKVKKIYAIGSSAEIIFKFFHQDVKVEIKKKLEDCVLAANLEARNSDVVLLSPACASYDMFDNYEHRGKVFKMAVESLQK